MHSVLETCSTNTLRQAIEALEQELPSALADFRPDSPRLLRLQHAVAGVSPMTWLRAQHGVSRYYWRDRDNAFTMAGIGEADVLEPEENTQLDELFDCMRTRLGQEQDSLRYYGGFRFQEGRRKGERWRKFKAYRFVAPLIEVQARGGDCALAANLLVSPDIDKEALLEKTLERLAQINCEAPSDQYTIPPVHDRVDLPGKNEWIRIIHQALEDIDSGEIEKVVLARETSFLADSNFDPVDVCARLDEQSFGAFVFCFQPAPHRAFLGASPERLYKRTGRNLQSEALAGTRPCGESAELNAKLARDLCESEKDLREHQLVVRMLEKHLAPLCENLTHSSTPEVMPLRNCQHLHTLFEATLKNDITDAALIRSLHPTPAVGGLARDKALAWLDAHEPFDRGIYAAPVGWVNNNSVDFAVAIRSAIVREETLALYAGAGIVPGSKAEEEWAEINQKMQSLLTILMEASKQ